MATFGGLKINTDTQVISTAAEPIAGLYAIPGAAGGIMNGDYWCVMSGYSVLGRISGATATAYARVSKRKPSCGRWGITSPRRPSSHFREITGSPSGG